ncbi:MAG TPA: amidohydrolase family protein [Candidatus Nanopelagicales bacterium]|nr:amidohydrolase family protein [Candidatus Nanopelagicales bacterium]
MTHHYTVLFGGSVLTFDDAQPTDAASLAAGDPRVADAAGRRATAICYAHERILAVGSDEEMLALAGPDSMVVDLRGRAVLPGFVEPHAHPYWEGLVAGMRLLAGRERRAALKALPGGAEHLDPDAWLVARYDPTGWDRPDDPTRDDLDRAVPDRPVLLAHVSGHAVTANSLALAMAGVHATTPGVPGRLEIERDAAGEPTGVLRGPDAWDRMAVAMPPPTAADGRAALARAAARLAADGVTSVADADVGSTAGVAAEMAAWGDALASGAMPLAVALLPGLARIAPAPGDPVPSPLDLAALLPAEVRARVRLSHVKLKADGALTTRTAWLRDPYADALHAAGPVHEPGELAERIRHAAAAGWASATHAIGDAAVAAVLDACGSTPGPPGTAHRIEHAMLLDDGLVARLAASGLTAVVQPEFLAWAGPTYRARLGEERASRLLPFSRLLAAGVPTAFSSDRPVVPGAPLAGVRAALRHDPDLSAAEVLHAWTVAGAAALGDEDAGCLAIGRRSDLVVLSGDPTAVSRDAWARGADRIRVDATVVAGHVVHGHLGADA